MQDVNFGYEGKNFVVCGASSGMGKQIALELAQAGATVLCLARRVEVMEQMKEQQGSGKIVPCFVDVITARASEWDTIFKNFVKEYGKINGGVYTAGIGKMTAFRRWNEDVASRIMDTSYWGMIRFMQAAAKKRVACEGSSFVVFSSTAAYVGTQGLLIYASAKAAVQTAVRVIAKEFASEHHRINSISPGWVSTEMTETEESKSLDVFEHHKDSMWLGPGTADKVSGMVLFLLSSRADWITGRDIVIDGGALLGGGYD